MHVIDVGPTTLDLHVRLTHTLEIEDCSTACFAVVCHLFMIDRDCGL